jgi:hypothetical protein
MSKEPRLTQLVFATFAKRKAHQSTFKRNIRRISWNIFQQVTGSVKRLNGLPQVPERLLLGASK